MESKEPAGLVYKVSTSSSSTVGCCQVGLDWRVVVALSHYSSTSVELTGLQSRGACDSSYRQRVSEGEIEWYRGLAPAVVLDLLQEANPSTVVALSVSEFMGDSSILHSNGREGLVKHYATWGFTAVTPAQRKAHPEWDEYIDLTTTVEQLRQHIVVADRHQTLLKSRK